MIPQHQIARAASRFLFQLRATAQRRLATNTTSTSSHSESAFLRERKAVKEHAASTTELWRKISLYVCLPGLILAGWNAYNLYNQHWEHWSHMPPLEERIEYSYQNIRTKKYPWGDGDKTLFWNDKVNYHHKD